MTKLSLLLTSLLTLLLGCEAKAPYQRKDGAWYFEDVRLQDAALPFTPLNASFAKGADAAWYRSTRIEGSDAASFEALDAHHAKDARRVYYGDTYRISQDYFTTQRVRVDAIAQADAPSFRLLPAQPGYARDRSRAYFDGEPFKVADVESFEPLDHGFARDRVQGYYLRLQIPGSDGASFVALDSHYAKDGRQVFHVSTEPRRGNETVPRLLSVSLPQAQPASFKLLEPGYAVDAGQAYYAGRVLTKDVATFSALPFDYAKSATQVFHRGEPIAGADAASFATLSPPTDAADAGDATRRYRQGRVVAP